MKSGNLNFLEPSGPLQACNGTDLPLPLHGRYITFAQTISQYECLKGLLTYICAALAASSSYKIRSAAHSRPILGCWRGGERGITFMLVEGRSEMLWHNIRRKPFIPLLPNLL